MLQLVSRYNNLRLDIEALYHEAARRLGLTDSSMAILGTLSLNGGEYLLRDFTELPKQTINSALRKLEADELVYLKNYTGRLKIVCLTEKGKKYAEETVMKIFEAEVDIFNSWTETEWRMFFELTQRYKDEMKEKILNF